MPLRSRTTSRREPNSATMCTEVTGASAGSVLQSQAVSRTGCCPQFISTTKSGLSELCFCSAGGEVIKLYPQSRPQLIDLILHFRRHLDHIRPLSIEPLGGQLPGTVEADLRPEAQSARRVVQD